MYSSSIFIPIVFIDEFKSFIYSFYNYDAATIQDNYEVFFLVLSISILLTVICKLWWFYIITLGLKITRMKEKWCIVAVIGAIELFNIAFTYGPIVPKVSGIISLAEKVDNYRELRNNMIVKFNNIKKGISSTDEINQLIDEIYTAQLITFDLAINKDMPGQFQYRYAVSSMIYFLFTEDITNKETLLMVDLVLNDDFVNAEKTLTNYIDKIEDAGLVKSSVLKALLEVVEKNQIYQKNYIDKGQSKDEDTIKMVFEFQKRQGLWGKLMLLTP